MSSTLIKIKRLVLSRKYVFTRKAEDEMFADNLTEEDVLESIVNANGIRKTIRSTSSHRARKEEKLYVIESYTYGGTLIYTKGAVKKQHAQEYFYVFVSSKRSTSV